MEKTITIDNASCIKCGKCVRICPSRLFAQQQKSQSPVVDPKGCISCGHCVAACPSASITHCDFPPHKIHKIDYQAMPTPEQVLLLCRARRSNRAFSKKAIPNEMIDSILEAAHRAPTASNMQQVEFTLITSPEKLRVITEFTLNTFSGVMKKLLNPLLKPIAKMVIPGVYAYIPTFQRIIKEYHENQNDIILRGATAVILIHTPKESRFGCEDANLAYQNGSLMAQSLDVSQFYTGFVCSAIKQDKSNSLAKTLGINGTIHAGMALGLPSFQFENYIDKKDIVVTRL